MKVGIMGGTFDPVHIGHLLAAECARESGGFDEIWFMPAFVPPHKPGAPAATPEQRLEMVRLAIAGHPHFRASDVELTKGGTSYTAETVELLQSRYPDDEFAYIIGADMVMYLPKWFRIDDIVRRISFVGLRRPGIDVSLEELPPAIRSRVAIVPMPQVDISSTDIRKRRADGRSIRYLVPDAVRLLIEEKGLYEREHEQGSDDGAGSRSNAD